MINWDEKKTLVTGGGGFVGSHLVDLLLAKGAEVKVVGRSDFPLRLLTKKNKLDYIQADLSNISHCKNAIQGMDAVFHLASTVAGIEYNISHHADMFRLNSQINFNMLDAARLENVERYQCTSSICVYGRDASIPTSEREGFVDDPEPTVFGYGWAKRVAELQARLYFEDYGMKISIIRPSNIYGPRDNFDIKTSHVIPAIIRKINESENTVTIWGSGKQTRSFVYVKDVVRAMMELIEKYPVAKPINIGTDEEISIYDLAYLIRKLCNSDVNLVFDEDKPEGQLRKFADISKAETILDWKYQYSLESGLTHTISWYKNVINS
jgi:GDP-L-fucose synthase